VRVLERINARSTRVLDPKLIIVAGTAVTVARINLRVFAKRARGISVEIIPLGIFGVAAFKIARRGYQI
jgi:hypothetical protein